MPRHSHHGPLDPGNPQIPADGADPADVSSEDRTALEHLLSGGDIHAEFQPIVELATSTVVGFEALARGPRGRWEAPEALFGIAARAGRVGELDAACRHAALALAGRRRDADDVRLFLNVEPRTLADPDDRAMLLDDLSRDTDRSVVVEITERGLGALLADVLGGVEMLREAGIAIALDDVGLDDSSLALLPLLEPDIVKLDLKLIQRPLDRSSVRALQAVGRYAERTGAFVLAEGIETETHLITARDAGAHLGQGWLFGIPTRLPVPTATQAKIDAADLPEHQLRRFDAVPMSSDTRASGSTLALLRHGAIRGHAGSDLRPRMRVTPSAAMAGTTGGSP